MSDVVGGQSSHHRSKEHLREALLKVARERMQALRGAGMVATLSPTPDDFVEQLASELIALLRPDEAVVELGCGDARILQAMARARPGHYLGIDIDAARLRLARSSCPTLELVCADVFSVGCEGFSAFVIYLSKEGNRKICTHLLRRRSEPVKVLSIGVGEFIYLAEGY